MTREQAQQFLNVYNALLTISTKGDDTKTMAGILQAMENLANSIEVKDEESSAPVDEPTKGE